MKMAKRVLRPCGLLFLGLGFIWACGFDDTLREYLSRHFWLPFAKRGANFEKPNVRRISAPFAGMTAAEGDSPLAKLRAAYQQISHPEPAQVDFDAAVFRQAVAAARADRSLTRREKEEVDLIDAKIDIRAGEPGEPQPLLDGKKKLGAFLRTARTPEFVSEARGWLARIHYLLGDQTAAGKIYLDELNRNGSNLSRETLLNSLHISKNTSIRRSTPPSPFNLSPIPTGILSPPRNLLKRTLASKVCSKSIGICCSPIGELMHWHCSRCEPRSARGTPPSHGRPPKQFPRAPPSGQSPTSTGC